MAATNSLPHSVTGLYHGTFTFFTTENRECDRPRQDRVNKEGSGGRSNGAVFDGEVWVFMRENGGNGPCLRAEKMTFIYLILL